MHQVVSFQQINWLVLNIKVIGFFWTELVQIIEKYVNDILLPNSNANIKWEFKQISHKYVVLTFCRHRNNYDLFEENMDIYMFI